MVHSLCRAGTVSASLLNGNQQANPASGPADDKGKAERQNHTTKANRGQKRSESAQKKCLSPIRKWRPAIPEQT